MTLSIFDTVMFTNFPLYRFDVHCQIFSFWSFIGVKQAFTDHLGGFCCEGAEDIL